MGEGEMGSVIQKMIVKQTEQEIESNVDYSESRSNFYSTTDPSEESNGPELKTTEELYAALTNKNHAIEILKRRLTNQQIQLGYYLHKNLATEAVLEFSNKCFPHLAEDSTQLSLAMYKFIRDTGGKTRLAQLREKLTDYNNRVHKALLRQEQLVRQGLANDFEMEEEIQKDSKEKFEEFDKGDDLRFAKNAFKTAKLELCSQLLSVTLQVRKELERFRVCSENVVRLEEERNALVDRVFSSPLEQYENLHVAMVDHEHRLDIDTEKPSRSSFTTSTSADVNKKTGKDNLGGALQDMESEAIQLLLLSEKQKNEFVIALEEARVENHQLKDRLRDLEEAASDERVIQLQEKCNSIEKEVEIMRKDLEAEQSEKERVIRRMAVELTSRDVNEKNLHLQLKQMKTSVELLRDERNSLQQKVKTFTQKTLTLVNQNTNTEEIVDKSEEASQNVGALTDLVVMQEEQIKDLLTIMSELQVNESVQESSVKEERKTSVKKEHNKIKEVKIVSDSVDSGVFSPESKVVEEPEQEQIPDVEEPEEYNIYYDSASDFSNQDISDNVKTNQDVTCDDCSQPTKSEFHFEENSDMNDRSRSRCRYYTRDSSRPQIIKKTEKYRPGIATTSLRVQAFDKDGKSESMHAVLECTSPVEGLLEMNNSSKLHLRLQCTSPQREKYYDQSIGSQNNSCMFSSEKHISGDHRHQTYDSHHLSREAKNYLSKQLHKIKSQLETSNSCSTIRKEIVHNLNEIYSQFFGSEEEPLTPSVRS